MSFSLSIYRKCWVDAIEGVKRKLEDGETVEADEANDPSNPFSKRGEKKSRKGKSKVVSTLTPVFHNISSKNCLMYFKGGVRGMNRVQMHHRYLGHCTLLGEIKKLATIARV